MPLAFGTAHNLLARAGVGQGSRLLVAFSGQASGYAAIRLALIHGAEVTGCCPDAATALIRAAGARLLNAARCPTAEFDAIIDLTPSADWYPRRDALVSGGRYVVPGTLDTPPVAGERQQIYLNDITAFDRPFRPRELFAGFVTVIETRHLRVVSQPFCEDRKND